MRRAFLPGRCNVMSIFQLFTMQLQVIMVIIGASAVVFSTEYHINCSAVRDLSEEQHRFCRQNNVATFFLKRGGRLGLSMCRKVMMFEKWNCTTELEGSYLTYLLDDGGTKEAAFVAAIRAAGMVYSLLTAYLHGVMPCPKTNHGANPRHFPECKNAWFYAMSTVFDFLDMDMYPPMSDNSRKIARHNWQVGMRLIDAAATIKCNGAACKTGLDLFEVVANKLHTMYSKMHEQPAEQFVDDSVGGENYSRLIYYQQSPNYCLIAHSKGRLCYSHPKFEAPPNYDHSCRQACCDDGIIVTALTVNRRICTDCKMQSVCCKEECSTCRNVTYMDYLCT